MTGVQTCALPICAAGPITGPAAVCLNSTETYSISAITGATSYTWTAPAGASILSGQGTTSISVSFSASSASGNVSVYGSNTAGNGAASNQMVTVNTVPDAMAMPDGQTMVDVHNTMMCNYTTTTAADSYVWTLTPTSAGTITGTTATATANWNASFIGTAEIKVKGHNTCGDGAFSPVKTVQVINTTGIDVNEAGIRVVTDETSGTISLIMNTSANQAKVMLLDLSGRMLLNTTIPGTGTSKIENQFKAGVYIIVVDAGSSSLKKKILVM